MGRVFLSRELDPRACAQIPRNSLRVRPDGLGEVVYGARCGARARGAVLPIPRSRTSPSCPGPSDAVDAAAPLRGLLPRALEYVFARVAEREAASDGAISFTLRSTFVEIYNERIYDLLSAAPDGKGGDKEAPSLQIREHVGRGVYIEGVTEATVGSAAEAHALWARGNRSRSVAATAMNRESSRSHSVFTLVVEATEKRDGVTRSRVAQFNLVDLAGSERQKLTGATGDRLKEAGQINKSLSALGNVIHALVDISQGKARHIHYRDSRLTWCVPARAGGEGGRQCCPRAHPRRRRRIAGSSATRSAATARRPSSRRSRRRTTASRRR